MTGMIKKIVLELLLFVVLMICSILVLFIFNFNSTNIVYSGFKVSLVSWLILFFMRMVYLKKVK